jgi:hypothetical protein
MPGVIARLAPFAALLLALAALAAGCGGSKNDSSVSSSKRGGIVAEVHDAKAETGATAVTASATIKVGGVPGKKVTLEWGLVDALQGNESQEEKVLHRYVTTAKVVTDEQSVKIPLSEVHTPLLVHFVLYGPDGSYLASDDTNDFGD